VVTGTLIAGSVSVGDEVEILPRGLPVRVRGLEVFGKPCKTALAGQRTAINLHGVDPASVQRGDILAPRGMLPSTRLLDVRLEAREGGEGLDGFPPIRLHHLPGEGLGRVRLGGSKRLAPGESGFAQIRLSKMIAALPGDRFILRRPSPAATLGGGMI